MKDVVKNEYGAGNKLSARMNRSSGNLSNRSSANSARSNRGGCSYRNRRKRKTIKNDQPIRIVINSGKPVTKPDKEKLFDVEGKMDYKKVRFVDSQQAEKMLSGSKDPGMFTQKPLDYSQC